TPYPFGLLRTGSSRPSNCRAGHDFDEIAPSHRPPKAQDRASYSVKRADWKGDAISAVSALGQKPTLRWKGQFISPTTCPAAATKRHSGALTIRSGYLITDEYHLHDTPSGDIY